MLFRSSGKKIAYIANVNKVVDVVNGIVPTSVSWF